MEAPSHQPDTLDREQLQAQASKLASQLLELQEQLDSTGLRRNALFLITNEVSYRFFIEQENISWSDAEMDFIADIPHYNNAKPLTKRQMDLLLSFFLIAEGVVSRNIIFKPLLECSSFEDMCFLITQVKQELIHAHVYNLYGLSFAQSLDKFEQLIQMTKDEPALAAKLKFMEDWMKSERKKYERNFASACAEGIFFTNLFAIIFFWKSKGLFPNFVFANGMIFRDETIHRDYFLTLVKNEIAELLMKISDLAERQRVAAEIEREIRVILGRAVTVADLFSETLAAEPDEDLTAENLKSFTRLIADNFLNFLDYKPTYGGKKNFTWLNDMAMEQKANFYEVRVNAYKKGSAEKLANWKVRTGLIKTSQNVYDNPEDIDGL